MKPLLALLCAVAIGYVAYVQVYPPFAGYFGLNQQEEPEAPPPPVTMPQINMMVPKIEEPKPEPVMETKPEPKPAVVAAPPGPARSAPAGPGPR